MKQANHNYYLWSEGAKTMWLACTWSTNIFNLEFERYVLDDGMWELILKVNGVKG